MPSTPTMKEADLRSAVVIDPEVVLAARADRAAAAIGPDAVRRSPERLAPQMGMSGPLSSGPPPLEAPTPTIDPAYRPSDYASVPPLESRSSVATWALRTGLVVLFGVFSAVAAAAWQTYGDQAQEMVGRWMPRISLTSQADKAAPAPQTATQPPANDDQAAAAPAQAADPAAPTTAAATGAVQGSAQGPSQDSQQLLQSMAHDLAAMGQQIADLKASVAQLKTSQDQMVQQMARAPEPRAAESKPFDPRSIEQTLRPRPARPAGAPAVAATTPVHRPRASPPPAQTFAPAPLPLPSAPPPQASSDPGVGSVVRPPMPVR